MNFNEESKINTNEKPLTRTDVIEIIKEVLKDFKDKQTLETANENMDEEEIEVAKPKPGKKHKQSDENQNVIIVQQPSNINSQQQQSASQINSTPDILNNFADIVGNFGDIITKPKDKENIKKNIISMLAGMIRISALITRKPKFEDEAQELAQDLDEDTKENLTQITYNEALKVRKRCYN
jgi:hypothetical protein